MEKPEFVAWMKADHRNFYELADTTGLADLIDVQNFCKLCPFSTRKVHEAHGESDMERIDGEVINHLWNMHKTEVSRKVQEQKAIEIASKPGQSRLL